LVIVTGLSGRSLRPRGTAVIFVMTSISLHWPKIVWRLLE